jgi:hypothetical protein
MQLKSLSLDMSLWGCDNYDTLGTITDMALAGIGEFLKSQELL